MSKEVFSVYHCKSCNKIEVTQENFRKQMEEVGFYEEELRPICSVTRSSGPEGLGQMTENELRHFAYSDVEGVRKYIEDRKNPGPRL